MPPEANCTCRTCGASFYTKPSQIRHRNGGQFCSRACKYAAMREPSGSLHPNWKGDEATVKTGRERAQRRFALGVCERCDAALAVDRHHVDGNTHNNSPSNVQALCRHCHMASDGRLDALRTGQMRKLTADQAAEIRSRLNAIPLVGSGRRPRGSVAALAAEFGVSTDLVKRIGTGKAWAEA